MDHLEETMLSYEDRANRGEVYEAHELFKCAHNRFKRQRKASVHPLTEAVYVLVRGASCMLDHHRADLGQSILNDLIHHLREKQIPLSEGLIDELNRVLAKFSDDRDSKQKTDVLKNLIAWVHSQPQNVASKFELEISNFSDLLGQVAFHAKDYKTSVISFLQSGTCALEAAQSLASWAQLSPRLDSEYDLFLTKAVFRAIHHGHLSFSSDLVKKYLQILEINDERASPLVNFLTLLLEALLRYPTHSALFHHLRQVYAPSLDRDSKIQKSLDTIAHTYYDIPIPQEAPNIFQSIFRGMMGMQTA